MTYRASAAVSVTQGQRVEIYGSEGTLVLSSATLAGGPREDATTLWGGQKAASSLDEIKVSLHQPIDDDPLHGRLTESARAIIAALEGDDFVGPDFEDGYRNHLVIDGARRAGRERRWVSMAEIAAEAGA